MVASTANITVRIDLTGQSDLLSPSRLVHQSGVLAGQVVRPGGAPQRGEVQPALLMNHVSHLQVVRYERGGGGQGRVLRGLYQQVLTFPAILDAPEVMSVKIFPSFTLNRREYRANI